MAHKLNKNKILCEKVSIVNKSKDQIIFKYFKKNFIRF